MKKRAALGLSGGVDSAVAAALLLEQGYEVIGVHLVCFNEPGCRADEDRQDALKVALKLNLPFRVLDFRKAYHDKVLGYFWSEIKQGRTPNPDIICNQEIKFGLFYQWALDHGFDRVATGHYARIKSKVIRQSADQKSVPHRQVAAEATKLQLKSQKFLAIPKDKAKDQTYFLYRLRPEQLRRLIFPLADLTKAEVRALAKKKDLPVAGKKDSTGICFIGELNVHKFLKDKLREKEGEITDTKGRVIGTHPGHWFFTLGQSGGWQILPQKQTAAMTKLYVVAKDERHNWLVVGTRKEAMKQEFKVKEINWLVPFINYKSNIINLSVRIRHRGELHRIKKLELISKGREATVTLDQPAFGVAPGQSVVLYQNGLVLGGGVIA
jgi:tRNA-specific 2-thiouridylase